MSYDHAQSSLFGFPRGGDPGEFLDAENFLREAWTAQYGKPPSTLSADLERLRDLFRTGVAGQRVRETVGRLQTLRRPPSLPVAVYVPIDETHGLITPEGRVLLEELMLSRERGQTVIGRDGMLRATRAVADAYGGWQREWLHNQLSGASLRPGSYGFILFLLVNGSIDSRTALRIPSDASEERQLAGVINPVVDAFAMAIGGSKTALKDAGRLRSNWRITEARRQMFGHVMREDHDQDAYVWIQDEDACIELVADRLSSRAGLSLETLEDALRRFERAYVGARPALSAWGAAHDRTIRTERVRRGILNAFIARRAAS